MKPLIAITCHFQEELRDHYSVYSTYCDAIESAGGIPVIIPFLVELSDLKKFDGFLLSGGGKGTNYKENENKLLPTLREQNPKRYDFELRILNFSLKNNVPVLGICRGMQTMNEAFGGTTWLNIKTQFKNVYEHSQKELHEISTHSIKINEQSKLFNILKKTCLDVNSFHKQAVKTPANIFNINAKSDDGIIEGIESKKYNFMMGLQFHPETLIKTDLLFKNIFNTFITHCKNNKLAK